MFLKTFAPLVLFLTGCAGLLHIPKEEAFYTNKSIRTSAISWLVTDDPTKACKEQFPSLSRHPVILACAGWTTDKSTCLVITETTTTHQILGHEIRHCFDGDFHNYLKPKDKP